MLRHFTRYSIIGLLNTALHWGVFLFLTFAINQTQSVSNFIAFVIAASFSFYANARWNFSQKMNTGRYLLWLVIMGSMAILSGWAGEYCHIPAILTLIAFSFSSLLIGFIFAKFIVFKERAK